MGPKCQTCLYYIEAIEVIGASPLSHDTVMQLVLLFDVGMIPTGPLATFAVVTAEDGGQLLLGHPVGRQGDGAFLSQAPAVLHNKTQRKRRHFSKRIYMYLYTVCLRLICLQRFFLFFFFVHLYVSFV